MSQSETYVLMRGDTPVAVYDDRARAETECKRLNAPRHSGDRPIVRRGPSGQHRVVTTEKR